jgi:DNA-binding transcriptional ArsR family regulator
MRYEEAKARAAILKALAHPIRFLIVDALSRADMSVTELNGLVDVDQSTISRHLAQLKKAGIVSERRDGAKVIHHLESPCILKAVDCSMQVLRMELKRRTRVLGGGPS